MSVRVAATPGISLAAVPGWLVAALLVIGMAAAGASQVADGALDRLRGTFRVKGELG